MKKFLVIAHTPSPNTRELTRLITIAGAQDTLLDLLVEQHAPLQTTAGHITGADGILLFTTENFGYMSGALKDMFDRIYYPCLEKTQGLPYCLCVRAGHDGSGTVRAVESIASGLKWTKAQAPLVLRGEYQRQFAHQAQTFAATFAAGLAMGIY